jgi:hypothetical protein
MGDSMKNNQNNMDVDNNVTSNNNENVNDYMIALLAQQQELELSGNSMMNPQYIANYEKQFREYQQNNNLKKTDGSNETENDEEIARLLQENYIREQEMFNTLDNKNTQPAFIKKNRSNNSNTVDVNLINYHNVELQKQYHERHVKNRLSHEYFRAKLNSNEAIQIKKEIKDFYIDFEQKSKNGFQTPDQQSQYLRNFLMNLLKELIENPLWANSDKEEQENAIVEMEKLITKKLFNITYGPSEDLAKDTILSQKIHMHSWVEPRHFDLPDFDYHIFEKAGNELQKMNLYKFYVDKIICVVNCIKLIEDIYLKNVSDKAISNDELLSLLIFIILKTNPKKLITNIMYIARYANPNLLSINIYEYSLTTLWSAITFIEKISQNSLTINSEEYDAKIIEITKNDKDKMDRPKSYSSSIKSNSSNRSSGLFRSVMGMFQSVVSNENDTNNDKDIPYQGIFKHLDSVSSANSLNRNESALSNSSVFINDYIKELKEKYFNNSNESIIEPFNDSTLTEEERNKLMEIDKELKTSLSINSNKGDENKN